MISSIGHRLIFVILMAGLGFHLVSPAWSQTHQHPSVSFDPKKTPIDILHAKGNVYMVNIGGVGGVNIAAQVGEEGILLVDSGPTGMEQRILTALKERFGDRFVQYIINTSSDLDHVGGNLGFAQILGRDDTATHFGRVTAADIGLRIISSLNAQQRMMGYPDKANLLPPEAWPVSAFAWDRKEFYFNGEPVILLSAPAAHTDGDIMVWFRGSDVIAAGDTFVLGNYPVIDRKRGGSLEGILKNAQLLESLAIAEYNSYGGTRIIPGHGGLTDEVEVLNYQFMLTIIRDRVRSMIDDDKSLAEIKAVRPTLEYDAVYGGDRAFWTPDAFLEEVYSELKGSK